MDCELGGHTGHFTITRIEIDGRSIWGCGDCIMLSADPPSCQ